LLGKYAIERVIAEGGMGTVVAARHIELHRRVAIKLIASAFAPDPEVCARFRQEARAAAAIRSEHVCRVLDVGETPDGVQFIVMEHLEGEDLDACLAREGPLSVEDAVGCLLEACEAIAEAHAMGIVHRDLKPDNLFMARRADGSPIVKVLDFGISKGAPSDAAGPATGPAQILGTPQYMAPEQIRNDAEVDARADIWALGATLYDLLSGERPFTGASPQDVIAQVLTGSPEPLCAVRPEVPSELAAVVERCLQKDPAKRFQTLAELARALAPFGPAGITRSVARIERLLGDVTPPPPEVVELRSRRRAPSLDDARLTLRSEPPGGVSMSTPPPSDFIVTRPPSAARPRRRGMLIAAACTLVAGAVAVTAHQDGAPDLAETMPARAMSAAATAKLVGEATPEAPLSTPAMATPLAASVASAQARTAKPVRAPRAAPKKAPATTPAPAVSASETPTVAASSAPPEMDAWDRERFGGRK
jgi:serine/threonine-protein kinase